MHCNRHYLTAAIHGEFEMFRFVTTCFHTLILFGSVLLSAAAVQASVNNDVLSPQNSADIAVSADYDGDGLIDKAFFRPVENNWYIYESRTGNLTVRTFGSAGDVLVPGDYTGDGRADIAVYRSGTWFVVNSETGETEPFVMGFENGVPAPGDYDNDGQTDFAVYNDGSIYIHDSSTPRLRSVKVQSPAIRRDIRDAFSKI